MLTKFAKPYEKSHEKNLNCFERYDALFEIKNNFQILVLGTPEGYPALDPFNFIKVDSKFGIMTQSMVHPRGVNHVSFVISAVTTTQYSMKKLEKLSWQKNHANHNFVIYVFVNAQKVVHPRGLNHMSFVISAVTTTQCSMRKLGKLSFMDF